MELDINTSRQVVDQAIDEPMQADVGGVACDGKSLIAELRRQVLLLEGMNRKLDKLVDALLPANHRESRTGCKK